MNEPKPDLSLPAVNDLQRFKIQQIARTEIKNAPYNPRTITAEGKAKLQTSLKELGLLQPLVWNARSGNLVGGHQRIEALDTLSLTGQDYSLTVAAVDLDDNQEKAANLTLNSAEVGGKFVDDKVKSLLDELAGKLTFDLGALISGQQKKGNAKLKQLTVQPPPKMAWVLVGIPLVRYAEIGGVVEQLAAVDGTIVESSFSSNAGQENRQPQS